MSGKKFFDLGWRPKICPTFMKLPDLPKNILYFSSIPVVAGGGGGRREEVKT
jgi:hypothetical protein